MLVLTRGVSESFTIEGGITITVLQVKGQAVRIGIEAPKELNIRRNELEQQGEGE